MRAAAWALLLAAPGALAGDAPAVARLSPEHRAVEVDPASTTIEIEFTVPMDRRGYSICGGGPTFPRITRAPRWKTATTLVVGVALAPGRSYRMWLNSQTQKHFRSDRGVPLVPVAWQFSTLPAKLRPAAEQKARNEAALRGLEAALPAHYSYYEYRRLDWSALFDARRAKILAARTDAGWASAAAAMLAHARDPHLSLRAGDTTFATVTEPVDPLWRANLLSRYLGDLREPGRRIVTGSTADGIAYAMIGSWTVDADLDMLERWMDAQRGAPAIILDVRPNGGGDEMLARRVARRFVAGTKTYARHVVRTGSGFSPPQKRRITGRDDRFGKPVAVLMGGACMSSCEAFLLMMAQAERCTLIGQRSRGSSGNPQPQRLANGVDLFVPSWKAMRADGTIFEGEGIAPDIEVAVTAADLETRDPVLERALAHLRK